MSGTKTRYLSRIKPLYIDKSRELIKEAADNQETIDYTELAEKFFSWVEDKEGKEISFDDPKKMTQYWIQSILLRDFGIYFPRKKSNKLTQEQLKKAQDLFDKKVKLPTIASEIGVQNLEWHDLFAGYNPKYKIKKKKNKHKQLSELIDTSLGDTIVQMKNDNRKLPDIINYINSNIQDITGIVPGTKVDNLFVQYYLYSYKNIPRNRRQSKDSRNKMYSRITDLLKQNYSHEDITDIINNEFNKSLKVSSVTSMIYSNGLNENASKKGRKKKYEASKFDPKHVAYMCEKSKEGLPVNVITDRLKEKFDLEIPKHGVKTILESLNVKKGQTRCSKEQMVWLEQESPSFVSLQVLEEEFNKHFQKTYDIYTLLKNATQNKQTVSK